MKTLRRLCAATSLTLALAFSAFAGDIQTPSLTSQPSNQISSLSNVQNTGTSVDGQMDTPLTYDPVMDIALSLMVSTLPVF